LPSKNISRPKPWFSDHGAGWEGRCGGFGGGMFFDGGMEASRPQFAAEDRGGDAVARLQDGSMPACGVSREADRSDENTTAENA